MSGVDPENDTGGAFLLSRRHFLHTAGLGSAGLLLAGEARLPAAPVSAAAAGAVQSLQFLVGFDAGAITSLKRVGDAFDTDYIASGRRLGDGVVRFRRANEGWQTLNTATLTERQIRSASEGRQHTAVYAPAGAALQIKVEFAVEDTAVNWQVALENLSGQPLEIGDVAFPLFMNSNFREQPTTAVLKHSFISGDGSFLFWMRRNSVGPYLTMTPDPNTHLEYWESQGGGYHIFVHSAAAGAAARERGTHWRQPNTSVTLAPHGNASATRVYGFKLQWAADYQGVREILVNEGLVDVHIVPGMTVPADLFARFALRTRPGVEISGVTAEFPRETTLRSLGRSGNARIYEVRFRRLGENRLTVRFGRGRHMHLEFFSTEPVETLIGKRAAFIASKQHRDPAKWYNGLLAEWALDTNVMLGPDNYDRIKGWRIYEVTCDDPGLSKPAFLAAK
ncbi:MAG TPA: DUF5695 domain-containing protein, partial [Longimicrobiales bacterium]|nr:DUF5695 domain-containing protein [Longimicrobiales bacterium]